jgi:hypothetical protein
MIRPRQPLLPLLLSAAHLGNLAPVSTLPLGCIGTRVPRESVPRSGRYRVAARYLVAARCLVAVRDHSGVRRHPLLRVVRRRSRGSWEHCSFAQRIEAEESICSGLSAQGKALPRTAVYPNLLWCSKFKAPIPRNLGGQGGRCTAQITSYPPLVHRRPTTDYMFRRAERFRKPNPLCTMISRAFPTAGERVAGP